MGAVEQILERHRRHPDAAYRVSGRMITIDPTTANGFLVSLEEGSDEWIVSFEGWHEHFQSEDDALNCFAYGLSERCRLRIDYRGSFAHRWALEERSDDGWREESVTGLLFYPFWRRHRVEYRWNSIIHDDDRGDIEQPSP